MNNRKQVIFFRDEKKKKKQKQKTVESNFSIVSPKLLQNQIASESIATSIKKLWLSYSFFSPFFKQGKKFADKFIRLHTEMINHR